MDTKRFNEEHAAKSRAVCERIEREDAERRSKLADLMDAQLKGELGRANAEADGWRKIAERRQKHTDECESALAKRNERISKLEKQVSDLRAELANVKVLSERERKILDMWPRFDDGKRVWFGDEYACDDGSDYGVCQIEFDDGFFTLIDNLEVRETFLTGERVKRPAPADSWEKLEEDALKGVCKYAEAERKPGTIDAHTCCGCRFDEDGDWPSCEQQMALDIIRRAKALAGVEVGE